MELEPEEKEVRPEIRQFLVITIALALTIWDISFNLGVYNTIFFDRIFSVWVIVTTTLLAVLFLRGEDMPVTSWGWVLLFMPSVWFVLRATKILDLLEDESPIAFVLGTGFELFIVGICLPYTVQVIIRINNPELLEVKNIRQQVGLLVVALVIGGLGYFVGANNYLFLTCREFTVSGNDRPANCLDTSTPTPTAAPAPGGEATPGPTLQPTLIPTATAVPEG